MGHGAHNANHFAVVRMGELDASAFERSSDSLKVIPDRRMSAFLKCSHSAYTKRPLR